MDRPDVFCIPVLKEKKDTWRIIYTKTGQGLYGSIWSACKTLSDNDEDCSYVMKVIPFRNKSAKAAFIKEVKAQNILFKLGISPKVEDYWICSKPESGVIVMKVVDMTVESFLTDLHPTVEDQIKLTFTILKVLSDMHDAGYYHGDTHLGNIMLKRVSDVSDQKYTFHSSVGSFRVFLVDMGKTGSFKNPGKIMGRPVAPETRKSQDYLLLRDELKMYAPKVFENQEIVDIFKNNV